MNQPTIDPALLSENVYPLWCESARGKATGPHEALPSSTRHTPSPISEGGQETPQLETANMPPDVYRLWCGSARGKAEGHHDPDNWGLEWLEFRRQDFLYRRRQALSSPQLAEADRLWFRSSTSDGSPTTGNPLNDWQERQHRRDVETHETVLLPVPPAPGSLSPVPITVLKEVERMWQWESWEEEDPDKTEKRPVVKPPHEENNGNER